MQPLWEINEPLWQWIVLLPFLNLAETKKADFAEFPIEILRQYFPYMLLLWYSPHSQVQLLSIVLLHYLQVDLGAKHCQNAAYLTLINVWTRLYIVIHIGNKFLKVKHRE